MLLTGDSHSFREGGCPRPLAPAVQLLLRSVTALPRKQTTSLFAKSTRVPLPKCMAMSALYRRHVAIPTLGGPTTRSEAARRLARLLHIELPRSRRSWPPAVGHKRP